VPLGRSPHRKAPPRTASATHTTEEFPITAHVISPPDKSKDTAFSIENTRRNSHIARTMTLTLEDIKEDVLPKLIPTLTPDEKLELTRAIWEYDEWDLQMMEDCKPGGFLDELSKQAQEEDNRGETEDWP